MATKYRLEHVEENDLDSTTVQVKQEDTADVSVPTDQSKMPVAEQRFMVRYLLSLGTISSVVVASFFFSSSWAFYAVFTVGIVANMTQFATATKLVLYQVEPEFRSIAQAILTFFVNFIGNATSPLTVGLLREQLGLPYSTAMACVCVGVFVALPVYVVLLCTTFR
ncbi:MAG: hypothetical protein MHM6MM_001239 [Cercozoa sp. M6MM]